MPGPALPVSVLLRRVSSAADPLRACARAATIAATQQENPLAMNVTFDLVDLLAAVPGVAFNLPGVAMLLVIGLPY